MRGKYKKLLHGSLGVFLLLGSSSAHAADAVWQGATSELSLSTNWSPAAVPTSTTLADFGVSNSYTPTATAGGLTALGLVFLDTDPTSYTLLADSQAIAIGASGVVNNSAFDQVLRTLGSGSITLAAPAPGGVTPAGDEVQYTISGVGASLTFAGATNGNGTVTVNAGGNTFTVGGDSTIGELESGNGAVVLNGSLTVTSMSTSPHTLDISGPGAFIVSAMSATPSQSMLMLGPNTYTGGTFINGGTVIADAALPVNAPVTINGTSVLGLGHSSQVIGNLSGDGGSVNWNGTSVDFNVNQTTTGTFAGVFVGGNSVSNLILGTAASLVDVGTLVLTGNSSNFAGNVVVNSGNLQVNGSLGGNSFTVNSGGILSGTGTFGTVGNVATIASGGTIAPGHSPGVITNLGNQVFNAGSFFSLYEDGLTSTPTPPGSNSLLIVNGTTTVGVGGAATVNLLPVDDLINLNTRQAFIESLGGLTVTTPFGINYVSALTVAGFNLDSVGTPTLSFDANNYYITTQTTFENAVVADGGDSSAVAVAAVFDAIIDPVTDVNLLLNELAKLPTDELVDAFDDLSGAQYATEIFGSEISNRRFLRRLYDPIRNIVTTEIDPCCPVACNSCCEFLGFDGLNLWGSAGGGQTQINGNRGLKFNEWDVTLGLQKTFCQDWTVGIAGSYEGNNFNYHDSNGSGRGHTWFGGLYGLYRPECWYVLADVTYGYTKHNAHRHVVIGDIVDHFSARPEISQATFYAETGFDYALCSFLIQPFVGIEAAGWRRDAFTERDLDLSGLALTFNKQNRTNTVGSLGVHLTDQFCSGFNVSIDLAWLYRFTNNNRFDASFVSINPDTTFEVFGQDLGRNSGEGAITFSRDFDNWRVFLEASGEVWSRASTYSVLGGFQVTW